MKDTTKEMLALSGLVGLYVWGIFGILSSTQIIPFMSSNSEFERITMGILHTCQLGMAITVTGFIIWIKQPIYFFSLILFLKKRCRTLRAKK